MKDRLGRALLRMRVRAVLPHVRGRLLDVGCGTNELVKGYAGEGVGVDVHPWPGVDHIVEDTSRLPYDAQSFDTVCVIAALNHIPNRAAVLHEIHRVLKPNGRLVMTMIPPGIARLWHWVRKPWDADQNERGMMEGELYGIRQSEVRRLLAEAGFTVERESRFMVGVNRLTIAVSDARPDRSPGC
jgi:SAM-dependent methyltransferase